MLSFALILATCLTHLELGFFVFFLLKWNNREFLLRISADTPMADARMVGRGQLLHIVSVEEGSPSRVRLLLLMVRVLLMN